MSALARRDFLRCAALVAAGSALPCAGRAKNAVRAELGLGFSLYGMKSLPVDVALKTCAEIGYDNVELALNPGYPTEPAKLAAEDRKKIRETLGALDLRLSGLMENLSLATDAATTAQHRERIKVAAQVAHDLAPDAPPPLETVLGGKPAEWEQIKERMAENVRAWAETAAAAKLVIALKPHVMSAVQTPDRALWLMEQAASPSIKLTYDYSHFFLQKIALADSLKAMLPHTRFIHVKDARGELPKVEFLLPGEGGIDYAEYFKLLRDGGYHGDVVVEVSGMIFNRPGYDPVEAARKSYQPLAAARGQASLARPQ